jgi:regulator of sigma E protease
MADPVPIKGILSYAAIRSVNHTAEIVGMMTMAVVYLFQGDIPRDTIGGPLMLAYTARVAAEKGWDHFLWMLAIISINLGILNLLPIPILDGGHILFFTIEAAKRKPLSLRAREIASYVGLFLILSLLIFAFRNDIIRYWFN